MNKPFQRLGSKSNSHAGNEFELSTQSFFESQGVSLNRNMLLILGVKINTLLSNASLTDGQLQVTMCLVLN